MKTIGDMTPGVTILDVLEAEGVLAPELNRKKVVAAIMAAATAHYPAGTSGGKGGQFAPGHPAYGTRQVLVSKLKAAGYTGPTSYPMNRLRAIADAHAAKTGVNVTTATGLTPGQQVAANIMATRAQPTNTPAPSAAFIAGRLAAQQTAPQPNAAFLAAQAITQRSMSQSPGLAPAQAVVTPVSTAGMKRTQLVAHLRSTGYTGPVSYNTDKLRDIIARRAGGVYTPAATAPAAPKTIPGSTLGTTVERFGATDRSVASHVKTIDVHTPAGLDEFNLIAAHVGVQGVTAADVAAITQHGQQTGYTNYASSYLRDDLSKALIARQALADLAADPKMGRNAMITLAGNSGAYIARKNASADAIRADLVKQFGVRAKPNLQRHADAARRAIAAKAKADAALQAAMASVGGGTQQGIGGLGKVLPKDFAHAAYAGDKGHPTPAGYTNRGRAVQQVASAYSVLGHDVARPHEFVDSLTELSTRDDIRTVVYRGVSGYRAGDAQKHVQQMASGTHYVGDGIYGQGTYSSPSKNTAAGYAGTNGLLMAFGIRKDAKIVKHSDVAMVQNALYASGDLRGLDIGTVAMMMGADVMQVDDGTNHHVIYNRTALVMVRPDANGKFKN